MQHSGVIGSTRLGHSDVQAEVTSGVSLLAAYWRWTRTRVMRRPAVLRTSNRRPPATT